MIMNCYAFFQRCFDFHTTWEFAPDSTILVGKWTQLFQIPYTLMLARRKITGTLIYWSVTSGKPSSPMKLSFRSSPRWSQGPSERKRRKADSNRIEWDWTLWTRKEKGAMGDEGWEKVEEVEEEVKLKEKWQLADIIRRRPCPKLTS